MLWEPITATLFRKQNDQLDGGLCAENAEVVVVAEAMLFERWRKEPVFVRAPWPSGINSAREWSQIAARGVGQEPGS